VRGLSGQGVRRGMRGTCLWGMTDGESTSERARGPRDASKSKSERHFGVACHFFSLSHQKSTRAPPPPPPRLPCSN
jgi:hypothetical protein